MNQLHPIMAARHSSPATFIHKELQDSKHDLLWQDTVHHALDPSCRGPNSLPALKKNIQDYWHGKQITMSADRVKPAYILEETRHSTTTNTSNSPAQPHRAPVADATPATQALQTTSSGHSIRFPACFNTHVLFSGGSGRVMWEHSTNSEWPFPRDCPMSADMQYTVSCSPHCCGWCQLRVNLQSQLLRHLPNTYEELAYCDSNNVQVNIKNKYGHKCVCCSYSNSRPILQEPTTGIIIRIFNFTD